MTPPQETRRTRIIQTIILLCVIAGIFVAANRAQDDPQTGGCLSVEVGMSSGAWCPDQAGP